MGEYSITFMQRAHYKKKGNLRIKFIVVVNFIDFNCIYQNKPKKIDSFLSIYTICYKNLFT